MPCQGSEGTRAQVWGGAATGVSRTQQWCPAGDIANRSWGRHQPPKDGDFGWNYCPHFAEEEAEVRVSGVASLRGAGGRSPSLERSQRCRVLSAEPHPVRLAPKPASPAGSRSRCAPSQPEHSLESKQPARDKARQHTRVLLGSSLDRDNGHLQRP